MLANVQVTEKNNFTPVSVWNYAGLQTGIHLKFVRSIAVCSQQDPQSPLSTWNRSLHLFQYTSHIHVSYFPQINKLINSIYTVNQLFPNGCLNQFFFQYQVLTTLFSKWLLLSVHLTEIMKQIFTKIQATLNVKFTL